MDRNELFFLGEGGGRRMERNELFFLGEGGPRFSNGMVINYRTGCVTYLYRTDSYS